jgi:hypothetical protein
VEDGTRDERHETRDTDTRRGTRDARHETRDATLIDSLSRFRERARVRVRAAGIQTRHRVLVIPAKAGIQ